MTPDMPAPGEFTPESLEAAFDQALTDRPPGAGRDDFLARVLEDFRPGELTEVTPADIGCVLASFWRFAEERREDAPTVRLVRARGTGGRDLKLDVLEIVQPDAPFLVDSVMGEVAEAGAEVRAMFHPVDRGRRPAAPR